MKTLEHKGYQGSVDFDLRSNCLHGKILHIVDLVSYEAQDVESLKNAFIESVDDYLETCKEFNIQPKRPYKGVFNVRMKPELHQKAAMKAAQEDRTLNDIVNIAVEKYVLEDKQQSVCSPIYRFNLGSFKTEEALQSLFRKPTNPVIKADLTSETVYFSHGVFEQASIQ